MATIVNDRITRLGPSKPPKKSAHLPDGTPKGAQNASRKDSGTRKPRKSRFA